MLVEFYTIGNLEKLTELDELAKVNSVDTLLTGMLRSMSLFFPTEVGTEPQFGSSASTIRLYKPMILRQVNLLNCFKLLKID